MNLHVDKGKGLDLPKRQTPLLEKWKVFRAIISFFKQIKSIFASALDFLKEVNFKFFYTKEVKYKKSDGTKKTKSIKLEITLNDSKRPKSEIQ